MTPISVLSTGYHVAHALMAGDFDSIASAEARGVITGADYHALCEMLQEYGTTKHNAKWYKLSSVDQGMALYFVCRSEHERYYEDLRQFNKRYRHAAMYNSGHEAFVTAYKIAISK